MRAAVFLLLALFVSPFLGAALRHWQSCCLQFSASVALWLSPFLLLALSARFLPWFAGHPALRGWAAWGGLGLWCLGAPISCLHALS